MKKKLVALLLTAGMAATVLAGCGVSVTIEDDDVDVSQDEVLEYCYTVQAYGLDDATLEITYKDDAGDTYTEETDAYGWFGSAGMTIGEMMAEWDMVDIVATSDEFEFLGWSAYTMTADTDEDGFEEFVETPLFDGKVFTTEEMMTQELPEGDIYFYTEWDFTCGGCEEQKLCDVYYIDDERYIVCDDCYEEFATGMGLLE